MRPAAKSPLTKTSVRLADGRELIYFDEQPRRRDEIDLRELPEPQMEIELRRDPLLDAQVVIASQRQDRLYLPPRGRVPALPLDTRALDRDSGLRLRRGRAREPLSLLRDGLGGASPSA